MLPIKIHFEISKNCMLSVCDFLICSIKKLLIIQDKNDPVALSQIYKIMNYKPSSQIIKNPIPASEISEFLKSKTTVNSEYFFDFYIRNFNDFKF